MVWVYRVQCSYLSVYFLSRVSQQVRNEDALIWCEFTSGITDAKKGSDSRERSDVTVQVLLRESTHSLGAK
jgi:hypothetical protein